MLLRKVNEHFIAQNWSAVTLDVIVLVIGVFIGIQVSNWNEVRLTRERGEELTERLIADLREEAWNIASTEQYMQDVLDNAERLGRALVGQSELANTEGSNEALLPALRWRIAEIESDLASMRFADESSGLQHFHPDGRPE